MAKRSEADALMQRIAEEFEALPRQLQGVARYLEENRSSIMVQRVGEIAEGSGVHASAVVRFAQRFGYSGFTEMQSVFKNAYTAQNTPARSYQQRIRTVMKGRHGSMPAVEIASRFIDASRAGLDELAAELDETRFQAAVDMLAGAENIYVIGVRRSFTVATYIAYALQHTQKRVHLVNGLGGMFREQMRSINKGDALIAISFPPFGKETLYAMGPLSRHADVLLKVKEGSAFAFRGLTSTMCLCQALFVALAYRLELTVEETIPRGEYDD
jgi:DNA-binding MurR/RpiR family transcriptional regulator